MERVILDLCGGTGSWSKPYSDAGYDVRLVTLPNQDIFDYVQPANVHGILAAPPCERFSLVKRNPAPNGPDDWREGFAAVHRCLNIIWSYNGRLKFWALENPVGYLRRFLGRPQFTFCHYHYGEQVAKPTDIWGWFNPPRATTTKPKYPPDYRVRYGSKGEHRSITPPEFAQAFFRANP